MTLLTLFWAFSLWGINASTKLIICSLFFVAFLLTGLLAKHTWGFKKAIGLFGLSLEINLCVLLIQGKSLHLYSVLPLMAGGCVSWAVKYTEYTV